MATAIYRITQLHTPHRGGMNAAVDADIRGIAKTNDACKYTIANEIICARIGQALGLPIPASVVAEDLSKKLYYLSLDVSREGKTLPPIVPRDFVEQDPWWAAGCFVFDVVVANGDRNVSNLSRDPGFTPHRVSVFDHGHALLGTNPPIGRERLDLARDRLGCIADEAGIASDHVFRFQALDNGPLDEWAKRVQKLPSYIIKDACRHASGDPRLHVDRELADYLAGWLIDRASRISALLRDNQESLPAVRWGLWGPGATS